MELQHFSHKHRLILWGENDPRRDPEWPLRLCRACGLPIFSTPSYTCSRCKYFWHEKCALLPQKLKHLLHHHTLTLVAKPPSNYRSIDCVICKRKPENFIYLCDVENCFCFLHLLCACPLEIKILHRSHQHELSPFLSECCFRCGACGEEHINKATGLSYYCHICCYWLHCDCARLPDTILHQQHCHQFHDLYLTYGVGFGSIWSPQSRSCAICGKVITSIGVYVCGKCEYYAHVRCATADPRLYTSGSSFLVFRTGLIRLPMADERSSVLRYLLSHTSKEMSTNDSMLDHDHPLISHDEHDDDGLWRRCDGCVQPISPPYYSCSHSDCGNFFLHRCCTNLPPIYEHPAHKKHPLSLMKKQPSDDKLLSQFICHGYNTECNGFADGCEDCSFFLDIVCAFLPRTIMHRAHRLSHSLILNNTNPNSIDLDCCTNSKCPWFYTCTNCNDFMVHLNCALIPSEIRHKYDPHPLKSVTDFGEKYWSDEHIGEICEQKIAVCKGSSKNWYYGCDACKQSFHVHCIPPVNVALCRFKFGRSIRLQCHHCPVTCIRLPAVGSYLCGYCQKIITFKDGLINRELKDCIAFQCSKCSFRIHYTCAEIDLGLSHHG